MLKQLAMTNNDILGASLLDIVFDNRNKQYGAYELRRHYNQRMLYALCAAIGLTALMLFAGLYFQPSNASEGLQPVEVEPVKLIELIIDPPPAKPEPALQPAAPQPPVATKQFTSEIEIVPDNVPIENALPPQSALADAAMGTTNVDGPATVGNQQPSITENGAATTPAPPAPEQIYDFKSVEEAAAFPGGMDAFQRFLARHLHTPEELAPGEQKTVQVRFVIQKDGAVLDMDVLRSGGATFDKEVIRVLKKLPRWKPARQNGHDVTVAFTLPVTFVGAEE